VGHNPADYDTHGWRVTRQPWVPDDLVAGDLTEVLKVY
jgi:hypothetical protein